MASLQFSVYPGTKGDVYSTEFVFTKTSLPSYINTTWDFGDGNRDYNVNKTTHTYNYPGIYTVALSAWSPTGELLVTYDFINVDYVYRDAIEITNLPKTWDTPGTRSTEPFYVSLTSAKIDQPLSIVLHSINSKSVPYDTTDNKWNFLNSRWRFIDAKYEEVVDGPYLLEDAGPLYKNNIVVAMTATAGFYYIDDSPTITEEQNCPVILLATLSAENFSYPPESLIYPYYSYSNNETVQAATIWQTKNVIPTELKITENYLNDIYYHKWTGIPIPVMITCSFNPSALSTFEYITNVSPTNLFAYPKNNEQGKLSPVDIKLEGYEPSEYVVNNEPLFFQKTDKNGLPSGGYIFTTITPLVSSKGETTSVMASTAAVHTIEKEREFPFPIAYPVDSLAFVAHPYQNNINKIQLASYDNSCAIAKKYKEEGILTDGFINCIEVPKLYTKDTTYFEVSGTSSIYGLSYNPITRILYGADIDKNTICAINAEEQIINTVAISAVTNRLYDTPSYISIDKDFNVWVSLYNSSTIIKYNADLTTVLASATPVLSAYDLIDEEGNSTVEPSVVETDRNNNVWACYSHPLSGLLVKYSSAGVLLTSYAFDYNSVPSSLTIDKNNNVWVTLYEGNKVQCFDTNGKLLSSLSVPKPSYIAVDRSNNIWVLNGINLCSNINTKTASISSWEINTLSKTKTLVSTTYPILSNFSLFYINELKTSDEIWGGLAVDVFDRVWIIDSENNKIGVFSTKTPYEFNVFGVAPQATKNYIIETNKDYTTEISTPYVRSAQANGDWTGNKWYQKYATDFFTTTIQGSSTPFVVRDLNTAFTIAKTNDDFNCASYFKSLALPEILQQNTNFFDVLMPAVVGDGVPGKQDLGKNTYERIANFVTNHSDPDTAELSQLHSLAEQLSVPTRNYGVDFPGEVNYYLSLFSIPRKHLMGTEKMDPEFANTIGPLINLTDSISAGQYIYAKDRRSDFYQLIFTTRTSAQDLVYPLSGLQIEGLRQPLHDNYYFFEYSPQVLGYNSNVIDWSSPYTTLSRTLSSDEIWYGDDEIIDLYFNNLLTKRLFDK
jgi:hypothetical protein